MYGQNDNGWDQGAVFLHPGAVWLSPFGAAQQLLAQSEPLALATSVAPPDAELDAQALRSADGARTLLRLVNWGNSTFVATFPVDSDSVAVTTLASADPLAVNPPSDPGRVAPRSSTARCTLGVAVVSCPPFSITVVRWTAVLLV